jgi:OmpA-OmpF porin, OOP family
MRESMRNYIIALLCCILPIWLAAQIRWETGLLLGGAGYQGDLNPENYPLLQEVNPAYGGFFRYYLTPSFSTRLLGFSSQLSGSDQNFPADAPHRLRNFSFRSNFTEVDFTLEWDPFGKAHYPESKYRYRPRVTPYFFAGAGFAIFTPKTDYQVDFERDENIARAILDDREKSHQIQLPVFPFGGGLRFDLGKKTTLALEGGLRFADSDYLDGVSASGNPKRRDWYTVAGMNLIVRMGARDSDGDGFLDKIDACPRLKGVESGRGCPDEDGDGVEDAEDACPDAKGTILTGGCPDTDHDGFMDTADRCPQDSGIVETEGCPDMDNDCIADVDDACPELAGIPSMGGCPDSDWDGVSDKDDPCPTDKGLPGSNGCPEPDTDCDGLIDKFDRCPEVADTTNQYGCPDTDKDGLIDLDDRCPEKAGPLAFRGCPDTDLDGISDPDDRCPEIADTTNQYGCPDTDKDGLIDLDDRCPKEFGLLTRLGCPDLKKEDKEVLLRARKEVRFKTGSAILLPSSKKILNQVASLMSRYPAYQLAIHGHTDSQGKEDFNLTLSKKRAKSCYDYLLLRSIDAERIEHEGFGETNPIADNKTAQGRVQNRRVEFLLDVKQ